MTSTVTGYVCDICGGKYDDLDIAEYCENSHPIVDNLTVDSIHEVGKMFPKILHIRSDKVSAFVGEYHLTRTTRPYDGRI